MNQSLAWRRIWFYGAIFVCLFLIAATVFGVREFNLRNESNFAAVWSGILLMMIGVHAYDAVAENKRNAPKLARAWRVITAIMVLLSFDEVGSLHERLPADTHRMYWLWVLPFALGFACMSVYSLYLLFRSERYRGAAKLITLAFVLFGSVAVQEELEWRIEWSSDFKPIRAAIEEGTELLGMILLLGIAMLNTRGRFAREGGSSFPVMEAAWRWRKPVLTLGLVGAPLLGFWTVNLGENEWGHGLPALWPPAAVFLLAGIGALRPWLCGENQFAWQGWALALLCVAGCGVTTLDIAAGQGLIPITAICVFAWVVWQLDARYTRDAVLRAGVFLAMCLGGVWLLRDNAFAHYCLLTYAALGIFYVHCSPPSKTDTQAGPQPAVA